MSAKKPKISLSSNVTFFVGENGTGKSTLLEAIAVAFGFNAEGGSRNFNFSTKETHTKFEKSGEFICYLNGHRHGDYVGYVPGFTDQLSIGMPPSGCYPKGYHNIGEEISDLPRIPGTVSEDCVNLYVLDREEKTISIVRMGAVVNDNFETRRALKLNY